MNIQTDFENSKRNAKPCTNCILFAASDRWNCAWTAICHSTLLDLSARSTLLRRGARLGEIWGKTKIERTSKTKRNLVGPEPDGVPALRRPHGRSDNSRNSPRRQPSRLGHVKSFVWADLFERSVSVRDFFQLVRSRHAKGGGGSPAPVQKRLSLRRKTTRPLMVCVHRLRSTTPKSRSVNAGGGNIGTSILCRLCIYIHEFRCRKSVRTFPSVLHERRAEDVPTPQPVRINASYAFEWKTWGKIPKPCTESASSDSTGIVRQITSTCWKHSNLVGNTHRGMQWRWRSPDTALLWLSSWLLYCSLSKSQLHWNLTETKWLARNLLVRSFVRIINQSD